MQTTSLPIQLNTSSPNPAQRNGASGNSDGAQFSAMLSTEMEMRQAPAAPAPAAFAPKTEAPKPQAADTPEQPGDAAPQQAAKPDEAARPATAEKADDAKDADSEQSAADEQAAQASDPASAMLALMASLQQPVRSTRADAGGAAARAFDALGGAAGKGKRGDAAQLAALQAAMKSIGKDGASAGAAGKAFADTGALSNPALAAAGAGLGADDKPLAGLAAGDKPGADPRAALSAAAGKAQAEPQLDAAELALQQAREAEITRAAEREPAPVTALAQAQPAVMGAVQAAAVAANELSARVGSDAWEHQVGQKVVYMVGSEEQTASLTLNPPDLGPLQVVLSVTNDQASVTFSANQEEVRQALENALPRLREMMSESGIALGNATVNAGMPDGRQGQEQAARNSGGSGGNGRGRGDNGNATEDTAARPVTRTARLGDRGMVDTFA